MIADDGNVLHRPNGGRIQWTTRVYEEPAMQTSLGYVISNAVRRYFEPVTWLWRKLFDRRKSKPSVASHPRRKRIVEHVDGDWHDE